MTAIQRQLHLGLMFWATGTHSAGWRHPLAKTDGAFDIAFIQEMALHAERAKFDFIFLGDRLVADPALARTNPGQMSRLEPFTVASAIAAVTRHIGLVVTANTTYSDPFTVARMGASLDIISKGRASWNIVTGADSAAALNFSRDHHWDNDRRYDWANTFTRKALALWHEQGALSMPRAPQGHPVLLHAGTSERSRDLGARYADVLFTGDSTLADAKAYYRDLKTRIKAYGRDPDKVKIIPGLVVIVEQTTAAAVALHDQLNRLLTLDPEDIFSPEINPEGVQVKPHFQYVGMGRGAKRNLSLASEAIGVDVRGQPHDALVPPQVEQRASPAGKDIFAYITRLTRRTVSAADSANRITYLDLIHASIAQSSAVVGNPMEVADYMQEWLDSDAADGFNIFPSFLPHSLVRFIELLVPELQKRGIYRCEYTGATLRENMQLATIDS